MFIVLRRLNTRESAVRGTGLQPDDGKGKSSNVKLFRLHIMHLFEFDRYSVAVGKVEPGTQGRALLCDCEKKER